MKDPNCFEFGPFRLDGRTRELRRDDDLIALTPKTFDLLRALVQSRDRVVSKSELIKLVWSDTFVSEESLTQHVAMLRKALGDASDRPQYVATVPRVGYRFIAAVRMTACEPARSTSVEDRPGSSVTVDEQASRLERPSVDVAALEAQSGRDPSSRNWRAIALTATLIAVMTSAGALWKVARSSSTMMPPIRFVVTAPEGTTLSPSASFLAVAPNGRLVAFLASRPGQDTRIWIRSLDSLDARELMGTDGALAPFWSPDSRHLGFFANNQLKTVSVAGEAPRVLCELAGVTKAPGGTWSRDGVILFSQPSGIYRTDTSGVSPRPETVLNPQLREVAHLLPHFLPDDRHFLYVARRSALGADNRWIVLKSLDANDEKPLLPAQSQALYADPGYLVFLRNGSLVAQRFDLEKMELQNDPLPIPETNRVGFNPATPRAMFSVSQNGVLTYRRSRPTELGWFDRFGKPLRWTGISGDGLYPALSPDGQRLAVSQYDQSTSMRSIWLLDLRLAGTPTRLTSARSWETCPVWSPDGTAIAFGSGTAGATRLYEKEVNTATDEQPLGDDVNGCPLGWSPKGDYVLYAKAGDLDRPESTVGFVSVLDPHSSKPIRVHEPTLLTGSWPTWPQGQLSPDGRFLAYVSDVSGRGEIYVRSFPDGARGTWQISDHGGTEPQWRDDGRELYFVGADKQLMAVTVDASRAFRVGTPTALFQTDLDPGGQLGILGRNQYVVAEHGQRFLINQRRTETPPPPVIVVTSWPATLR